MLLGGYSPVAHRGIARYASEHSWHLHVDVSYVPVIPTGWTGDGIIAALGEWKAPLHFIKSPQLQNTPVVDIYMIHPEIPLPRVVGDHQAIGRLAADHFLSRGWRHFAWFSRAQHPVAQLRRRSYEELLRQHGHSVIDLGQRLRFDLQCRQWHKARALLADELIRAPKPMAVFAYNDYDAVILMEACLATSCHIPDDIAILGVDDNELVVNSLHVPLSSIHHDMDRVSYEGAALLNRLMQGEPPPAKPIMIPPRGVVVRASTDTFAVNHPAVCSALRFMNENLHRSLGVEDVARASELSRRGLEEAFRKELRQTVHDELMRLRIQRVKDLLLNTSQSVEDIAAQTGFSHASHLHRVFQNRFGATPRAFRLKHQSTH